MAAILAVASVSAAQTEPKIAGMVNGEAISEDQVLQAAAADLQRLAANGPGATVPRARLEILHRALDAIVEEKVIALEAARQQVSRQQIVHAEIESNVVVPT